MITLELAKQQLRLDETDNSEDDLIQLYIDAATDAAALYIGIESLPDPMPSSIEVGILMFIGTLYSARQDVTETQRYEVPQAIARLWGVHREHGVR